MPSGTAAAASAADGAVIVAARAVRDAIRDQLGASRCVQPFAFVWTASPGALEAEVSAVMMQTVVVAASVARGEATRRLVREVRRLSDRSAVSGVVLVAVGRRSETSAPTAVSLHVETPGLGRRLWVAPIECVRGGSALGHFFELRDGPREPPQFLSSTAALLPYTVTDWSVH